jgi:threonine aldolase
MPKPIDLRSDTVTKPTQEMRDAMWKAEVGDDYYFEDPTVRRLEELAADTLGKEDALFVASGTMGNLVSIFTAVRPGDVIIVETNAHIFRAERGHLAAR